ncbi:uncharacterized protein LOC106165220 [Lingula anatina]|uniref:Uncharacterized protein LOC106165220 n=1 Tax=Lingula anatina TaxID=7574 RepID=A0A1S3IMM3_LINAN|nr:uncharacterized protein LOC106165220 [Lingula anatina]|eukprot:XP_013398784.1 uncharacterized protein LOC106165220 [Lingula anatina]
MISVVADILYLFAAIAFVNALPFKDQSYSYQEEAYPDGYGEHGFEPKVEYPKAIRGPCVNARDNGNVEIFAPDPCAYLECVYTAHDKVGFQLRRCPPGTRFNVSSLMCDMFDNGCNMVTHAPVYPPREYVHKDGADSDVGYQNNRDVIPHGHVIEPTEEPSGYDALPKRNSLPEHFNDLSVLKSVYDIEK